MSKLITTEPHPPNNSKEQPIHMKDNSKAQTMNAPSNRTSPDQTKESNGPTTNLIRNR